MREIPTLFQFEGEVQSGRGEGRRLGYPTANVRTSHAPKFPAGVYAGWVEYAQASYPSAIVIGAPGLTDCCEVHLLDFQGELYGQHLICRAVAKIREMKTFTDPMQLQAQIAEDLAKIRQVLDIL
jgi:riboflavin kinase/FMN adenylyltransferase